MNREEALKTRSQLEALLKKYTHKNLAITQELCDVTKDISGTDAKIATLNQKKSDIPVAQRKDRIEICKLGIGVLSIGLICAILFYFTYPTDKYIVLITVAIIVLICAGLFFGYLLWSNQQTLKQDLELDKEISDIKNSTDELIKKRGELQEQYEAFTVESLKVLQELKTLTDVK